MDLNLEGRTAIVCGASAGIGLGVAESLAAEGANLVMFARSPEPLGREAERLGGIAVPGDVTSADDLERLVQTALDAHGGIDILVNNSGGPPRTAAVGLSAEQVETAVRLLLVSVVRLTGLCLPHLEQSDAGRIVNITSSTVKEPTDNLALSNAVRPGVIGWAKSLSRELGPGGNHRQLDRPRANRHRAHPRGLSGRAERGRPRGDPAPPARDAARDRRRRGLPLLGAGLVRHGNRRRRRRRPRPRASLRA